MPSEKITLYDRCDNLMHDIDTQYKAVGAIRDSVSDVLQKDLTNDMRGLLRDAASKARLLRDSLSKGQANSEW